MTTSAEKARAWRYAAAILALRFVVPGESHLRAETRHMLDHIIPALIRRAEIIERNGRKR